MVNIASALFVNQSKNKNMSKILLELIKKGKAGDKFTLISGHDDITESSVWEYISVDSRGKHKLRCTEKLVKNHYNAFQHVGSIRYAEDFYPSIIFKPKT
jgi:hypothetical protein